MTTPLIIGWRCNKSASHTREGKWKWSGSSKSHRELYKPGCRRREPKDLQRWRTYNPWTFMLWTVISSTYRTPTSLNVLSTNSLFGIFFTSRTTTMKATYVSDFHDNERIKKMRYYDLGNTGMKDSIIGFGAAPLGRVYDADLPEEQGVAALQHALRGGVNYIDTAPFYGQGKSEAVLGKALKDVPREAYYIATKVGRYELDVKGMFDFSADRVTRSIDESLKRLGLDYVDLIQVHDVEFASSLDLIIDETLPALDKIREEGKARFIGLTGYPIQVLRSIVERSRVKIDTVLSYCHLSLNDSSLLQHVTFFQERNIGLISASPLSMALLTARGPPSWHPAHDETKKACHLAVTHCKQHGHDLSELALKYSISHVNAVPLTLIGMDSKEQVDRNLKAVHDGPSDEQEQFITDLIKRFFTSLESPGWEGEEVKKYREKLTEKTLDETK